MLEHSHTVTLVDGSEVTFHLRNTLFEDIREYELAECGGVKDAPDRVVRDKFCYIIARVKSVEDAPSKDWLWPDGIVDEASFNTQYRRFARNVNDETLLDLFGVINMMKTPNKNPVTKPDEALSEDEKKDPKSNPPAKTGSAKK